MKKYIPFLLIASIFLSACSIDWNNEKDKKIVELENEITELQEKIKDSEEKLELSEKAQNFQFDEKCKKLAKELPYGNIVGGYYDSYTNQCYVRYTENGITLSAPMDQMEPKTM